MNWPQWTMIVLWLFAFGFKFLQLVKDKTVSSEKATFELLAWVAYFAFYSGLLHAGGFW